jgi:arylsulfatase A-like enzyme/Tfp pilus assembly protein PilF
MDLCRLFLIVLLTQCLALAAPRVGVFASVRAGNGTMGEPSPKADETQTPANETGLPNIILITLDTTRADRMGFLGSKRGLTPNLDALAQESAVFTHAYAQVPLTTPSHATILSGTYPQFHGLLDFPMGLPKDVPYGPEILHVQGYHTAAFVGSMALAPKTVAPGFDRGFDTYNADFHPEAAVGKKFYHKKDRYQSIERSGDEVVALALEWLKQQPKGPFFLWVHLYDAHAPYEPPEPYATRYSSKPYDGGVAYEDAVVGKFIEQLKVRKLYDGSVIAVMSDHGESLGAHGEDTHGVFLYDETIHVPLTVKLPHGTGKRFENRVELVDVMPTLLDGVGIKVPAAMQGESLLKLMKGDDAAMEAWRDRSAYAQADYGSLSFGWSALQSWRTGKYLYVQAPRRELYDQIADPKAVHNLAGLSKAVADTLAAKMEAFREKTSGHREAADVAVDPEAEQKLAALGYVASSNVRAKSDRGADPKDRIAVLRMIEEANSATEDGRLEEAVPILMAVIAKEPNMAQTYTKLAGCYMGLREYDKAISVLRKFLELHPDSISTRMNLGKALLETKDYDGAASTFESLAKSNPKLSTIHTLLEATYLRSNRFPEAITECEIVLADSPDDYDSNLILGLSLLELGKFEAAKPRLQKAAEVRLSAPQPHMLLSVLYSKMGRTADAERERAEAIRLGAKPGTKPSPTPLNEPMR